MAIPGSQANNTECIEYPDGIKVLRTYRAGAKAGVARVSPYRTGPAPLGLDRYGLRSLALAPTSPRPALTPGAQPINNRTNLEQRTSC